MDYIKITRNKTIDSMLNIVFAIVGIYAIGYMIGVSVGLIERIFF